MAATDERLAEAVRNFPCLYQKNIPEFKDKHKKEQAWYSVAETVGLQSGHEAKTLFSNLRSRYSRYKKKIQAKQVSGASTGEVSAAKKETSELFLYLSWLDEYVQPRRTKSNFCVADLQDDHEDEGDDIINTPSRRASISDAESSSSVRTNSTVTGHTKYKKRKLSEKMSDEKTELEIMKSINESLKNPPTEGKAKNEDDLYSELLSVQLKQLPDHVKLMVKMQINNIVYNHLLQAQGNLNQSMHDPMVQHNSFVPNQAGTGYYMPQ